MSLRRFASWVLGFLVAVVMWGALVRATGSGAGCGSHWPLCNGAIVPRSALAETLIEYTHRVTSFLAAALIAGLVVWTFRAFPRRHVARKAAVAACLFMVLEAAFGAALVLFGWVGSDASPARGWVVSFHLVNTFFLLGAVALTAQLAGQPGTPTVRGRGPLAAAVGLALITLVLGAATGAIAALGDTLYPARSMAEGFTQDLSGDAPFLLRLRLVHPFASLGSTLVILAVARAVLQSRDPRLRPPGLRLLGLLALQLLAGGLNVALLAPVWLQLVHLALAQLLWIVLVMLATQALSEGAEPAAGNAFAGAR